MMACIVVPSIASLSINRIATRFIKDAVKYSASASAMDAMIVVMAAKIYNM
jgi:hypothetical protein